MRFIGSITVLLLLVGSFSFVSAAPQGDLSLEIEFDKNHCSFQVDSEDGADARLSFKFDEVRRTDKQVFVGDQLLADEVGFHVGQYILPYDDYEVRRVPHPRDEFSVLLERKVERRTARHFRGGDYVIAFEPLRVESNDFVRGDVFLVGNDLLVEGEVNGNVIVMFGNARLTRSAICRKDVYVIDGKLERSGDAHVYGLYQSTKDWQRIRSEDRDVRDHKNVVEINGTGEYNRVDGLMLQGGVSFHSEEEFMPEFYADLGYGFWSKRSKYRIGLRHKLFDYYQLSFGGQVYRLTETEDAWRCTTGENTLYALIAREDFRDYYQGEGGNLYIEQKFTYDHAFRLDYRVEKLDFMRANPNLWSLFGGDKKFRSNFSSVEDDYLNERMADFEKDDASLKLTYIFNTSVDRYGELLQRGWYAEVSFEHSSDALGSDFDYDRFLVEIERYQPLTYRQNLNVRLRYGSAGGSPPLHKLYYLGGIRTLRAFDIKEFYGTYMALANFEYVLDFPRTDIGVSVLFDVGKTGWCDNFLSEGDWLADVGVGFSLGDVRAELTRPINSDTDKLQYSMLIGRSF